MLSLIVFLPLAAALMLLVPGIADASNNGPSGSGWPSPSRIWR